MLRVLFFGKFSEFVDGSDGMTVEASGINRVQDLLGYIAKQNPSLHLEISAPQVMIAVNQQIASSDALLTDGDEIAFLPPVTGG